MSQKKTIDYTKLTRHQAERAIGRDGVEAATALQAHPNYHVKRKAWMKLGAVLPPDDGDRAKLLDSLKLKNFKAKDLEVLPPVENRLSNKGGDEVVT